MKGSGYMNETLKDGTIDLLLDGVKKKIDSVKENFKWKRLFVDTGDFFINNPDMLREFENDLYSVFSEDNLYRLAQKLKNKRGYEFPQLLYKELHDLMICNEIPEREAETYSYHFVQVIINYLEDNDQEKTMEIFLGEMRRENEGNFTELKSTLEAVVEKINALGNEEVKVYSIADIDVEIKKKSKYKRMGLDFFELDDEQFESKFQNVIENDLIYVVGKSREETTFRILNELRSKKLESKTLIIKSEEEWDKLQKTSITGNILIPFFYTDQIAAITNNTNIFVYGEDEPCYTRDKLVLRKRTKRNIINSLENIGIDTQEAYNVVDNTHGLYVPLKKKIFNEANHVNPAWVKSHSSVIMAALLCGKWTDSEGDKLIFEELAGKTYAELVKILFKGEENEPDDEEKRNLASKVYDGFYKAKFCPTEQDGKVVYEDIRKWIDDFKERLIEQKQERLFGNLIGHLLAYAPIGEDGYSPCEAVRKIIEENPLDTLKNAYVIEEENKRGVHTADAGKSELILSDRYKKNAEGLQEHYPQTAEIYFTLSDNYKREAAYERKRAEDEW